MTSKISHQTTFSQINEWRSREENESKKKRKQEQHSHDDNNYSNNVWRMSTWITSSLNFYEQSFAKRTCRFIDWCLILNVDIQINTENNDQTWPQISTMIYSSFVSCTNFIPSYWNVNGLVNAINERIIVIIFLKVVTDESIRYRNDVEQ
jgi:hypothetical protein